MDPLTITATCISILATTVKTVADLKQYASTFREARSDIAEVLREAAEFQMTLEMLRDDDMIVARRTTGPGTLLRHIQKIASSSNKTLLNIQELVAQHHDPGGSQSAWWLLSGKAALEKLQGRLQSHRIALCLALDIAHSQGISRILHELEQLRITLATIQAAPNTGSAENLEIPEESFYDEMNDYAETVVGSMSILSGEAPQSPDSESVRVSSASNSFSSGIRSLKDIFRGHKPKVAIKMKASRTYQVPHSTEMKFRFGRAVDISRKKGLIEIREFPLQAPPPNLHPLVAHEVPVSWTVDVGQYFEHGTFLWSPTVSKDGKMIALLADADRVTTVKFFSLDGKVNGLIQRKADSTSPKLEFSPDGRILAFVECQEGQENAYFIDVLSGLIINLSKPHVIQSFQSANGKSIFAFHPEKSIVAWPKPNDKGVIELLDHSTGKIQEFRAKLNAARGDITIHDLLIVTSSLGESLYIRVQYLEAGWTLRDRLLVWDLLKAPSSKPFIWLQDASLFAVSNSGRYVAIYSNRDDNVKENTSLIRIFEVESKQPVLRIETGFKQVGLVAIWFSGGDAIFSVRTYAGLVQQWFLEFGN